MKTKTKKIALAVCGAVSLLAVVGAGLYVYTQSLLTGILQNQLRQAGFAQARVETARLYLDGIVIPSITLDDNTRLINVFTPQSAPDLAEHGVQHIIVKRWEQAIDDVDQALVAWPWPHVQDISVEEMTVRLSLPMQTIRLSGTLKSLRPDDTQLVLLLPFDVQDNGYAVSGKLEITVEKNRVAALDINVEDGSYHSADMSLKRVSGWFNAQANDTQRPTVQAQFMAGAVTYTAQPYADGMVQYSRDDTAEKGQWTVSLNRPADAYFNSWVIKPTADQRFAVQAATQNGTKTKSAVMISAAPLRLEPLLPPAP